MQDCVHTFICQEIRAETVYKSSLLYIQGKVGWKEGDRGEQGERWAERKGSE